MKHTIRSLAIAAALSVAALLTATGHAQAYACKPSPAQATGTAPLKMTAQGMSKQNWTNHVKSIAGLSWSVWTIAANPSSTCNKLANGKWTCLASAKPCNYVVQ